MSQNELIFRIKATNEASKPINDVRKAQDDLTKATNEGTKANATASATEKKRASSLKDVDSQMARMNDTLGKAKMAFGIVGAAVGVYGAVVSKVNKEWAEQNKLNQNLEKALLNVGTSAETSAKQVDYLNERLDRMSRVTRFDDEILSGGLSKLTEVTGSAALGLRDLELAMNMSTKTGKDLNGMVDAITKAYAGEYQELVPLGLISKKQANEFQSMTDKGMATQKVLELLRDSTKGLATNLTTAEKAARGFNADFDALMETMGKGIEKVLTPLNRVFGELVGVSGGAGLIGGFTAKLDAATTSWGRFIDNFADAKVENFLKVAATMAAIGATGGMAAVPLLLTNILSQDVAQSGGGTIQGYVPGARNQVPDIDWDPNITYNQKKARKAKGGVRGGPKEDPNQALLRGIEEDLRKRADLERELDAISMERFNRESAARAALTESKRYELEHQKNLEAREKERQESQRKHQEWLVAKQAELHAAMVSSIQQTAGLLQQGAGLLGAPSGVGSLIGGGTGLATGIMTMNPFAAISGGLTALGGLKDLFGGGSKEEEARIRDQKRRDEERMIQDAKKERIEFQKSLQNAIVDALRESRENLAITYIINQSGTYLGGDPASLRQVRTALESGRLERRR